MQAAIGVGAKLHDSSTFWAVVIDGIFPVVNVTCRLVAHRVPRKIFRASFNHLCPWHTLLGLKSSQGVPSQLPHSPSIMRGTNRMALRSRFSSSRHRVLSVAALMAVPCALRVGPHREFRNLGTSFPFLGTPVSLLGSSYSHLPRGNHLCHNLGRQEQHRRRT